MNDFGLNQMDDDVNRACSRAFAFYASGDVRVFNHHKGASSFPVSSLAILTSYSAEESSYWLTLELPLIEDGWERNPPRVTNLFSMTDSTKDPNDHGNNILPIDEESTDSNPEKQSLEQRDSPDKCSASYKFVEDTFTISGRGFNPDKFSPLDEYGIPQPGLGLKNAVFGCGAVTGWSFVGDDSDLQSHLWTASGRTTIGQKTCIGHAVTSAGGSTADGCTGAG